MTYKERKQLYESIIREVSVELKRLLDEKYGSAYDNPDIYTDEIKKVILNVMDSIRDSSYLNWEEIELDGNHTLYAKIFWLKNTKWMEGVQICLWPEESIFDKNAKASYHDGQLEESGKMTAIINLFNVKPGHCEDIYYDYFIHEFKHAYFDYTKMKSGKVNYHMYGERKMFNPTGRRFSLYDDDSDDTFFNPKEKSVAELVEEYENDRNKMSKDVLLHLRYIS